MGLMYSHRVYQEAVEGKLALMNQELYRGNFRRVMQVQLMEKAR